MSPRSTDPTLESKFLTSLVWLGFILYGIYVFGRKAYLLRMFAIDEYGPVIHEFDPYFNWRATEYLYLNGWQKFVTWFDYKVWYPLGRPVGTTIYPGMQVTAVFLKTMVIPQMSLNDVCCHMPAWFGVSASLFTGLMAYECSLPQSSGHSVWSFLVDLWNGEKTYPQTHGSSTVPAAMGGVTTMAIMSMIPAHLMRSIGGGYDNESVAVTAMTLTFWLWCRSLRSSSSSSWMFGALAGLAYFYMVAAWGGYVFVLNVIGLHAAVLVATGRFSSSVYKSYSLFYVIGTALATRVPVVGMTPLKSLEQLGPAGVFCGYQLLQFCEVWRKRNNLSRKQAWFFRIRVFLVAGVIFAVGASILAPTGYFGPISARVRGLFVKHTKTGNPLVDSVAEHQPASGNAYYQYLNMMCYLAPVGFFMVLLKYMGDGPSFLLVYGFVAFMFSSKMVRLILLLGPIASAFSGLVLGKLTVACFTGIFPWLAVNLPEKEEESQKKTPSNSNKKSALSKKSKAKKKDWVSVVHSWFDNSAGRSIIKVACVVYFIALFFAYNAFDSYCTNMAKALSNPTIIQKGRLPSGKTVVVDDYREAYFWIRDNTPDDARILSWWDYGYQITGIANRTTLADGNTWNHEHIALLGRILTTSEEEGYEIARHLADYVLVWAGGGGDDLAKSPHLARIANSVYRNMCPGDPICKGFGMRSKYGTPSAMMERSFLYKLHGHKVTPGVKADPDKFQEVFRSKYGKVRIYKILDVSLESKKWVIANRECDVPGSWFCPGKYPPALDGILAEKHDFAQLEDFNRGKTDKEYQKAYFEQLNSKRSSSSSSQSSTQKKQKRPKQIVDDGEDGTENVVSSEQLDELLKAARERLTPEQIQSAEESWADTERTTLMWKMVTERDTQFLTNWLLEEPLSAFMRSGDGRGPMWWAYETRNMEAAVLLTKLGVKNDKVDKYGMTPVDMVKNK